MPTITKEETAEILDKTTRAVERYAADNRLCVTYAKGKTRDVPMYDRAEVEALAEKLKQPLNGDGSSPESRSRPLLYPTT